MRQPCTPIREHELLDVGGFFAGQYRFVVLFDGRMNSAAEHERTGYRLLGQVVFAGAGTCAKCHVVNGEEKSVGPNLSGVGAKLSREALYESVLAPSAAISHSYETFTALMEDGGSVTGLLVSQSPEQVVIRGVGSIDVTLPAGEFLELVKQRVSLMPADLVTTLSADELVDVVAWMEMLRVTQ